MYDKLVQEPSPLSGAEIRSDVWTFDMTDSTQRNAELYDSLMTHMHKHRSVFELDVSDCYREQGCQLLLYVIKDSNTDTLPLRGRVLNVTTLRQRITEHFHR
jgi:hypothetical protein